MPVVLLCCLPRFPSLVALLAGPSLLLSEPSYGTLPVIGVDIDCALMLDSRFFRCRGRFIFNPAPLVIISVDHLCIVSSIPFLTLFHRPANFRYTVTCPWETSRLCCRYAKQSFPLPRPCVCVFFSFLGAYDFITPHSCRITSGPLGVTSLLSCLVVLYYVLPVAHFNHCSLWLLLSFHFFMLFLTPSSSPPVSSVLCSVSWF